MHKEGKKERDRERDRIKEKEMLLKLRYSVRNPNSIILLEIRLYNTQKGHTSSITPKLMTYKDTAYLKNLPLAATNFSKNLFKFHMNLTRNVASMDTVLSTYST